MAKRQLVVGIFFFVAMVAATTNRQATGASVRLAWDASPDEVAGYNIWFTALSNNQRQALDVGNTTNAVVDGLAAGETYEFYATAYDTNNVQSDPSNIVTFSAPLPPNQAPSIASIPPQTVEEGRTLSLQVSATDPDGEAQGLRFSLGPNAPLGAAIDQTTGSFAWRPSAAQAPSTNLVSFIVTDSGTPPMSATNTVSVVVQKIFLLNVGAHSRGRVELSPATTLWPEGYRYAAGTSVQLRGVPDNGNSFFAWEVDGKYVRENPISLSMTRHYTVTPKFLPRILVGGSF